MTSNQISKFIIDNIKSDPDKWITLSVKEIYQLVQDSVKMQYEVDKERFTAMLKALGHDIIDGEGNEA